MPYPNYHSARLRSPSKYKEFRNFTPKGFPEGVTIVLGVKEDGETEFQAIRASKKKFTLEQFKKLMDEKGLKPMKVEPAKKSMDIDLFSTWLPLSLIKSEDGEPSRTKIGGIISTDSIDQQGDVIDQDGMDFTYFLQKGYFNYEHKGGVEYILGAPTRVEKIQIDGKNATRVEGYLMNEKPLAKKVIETVQALEKAQINRKIGFSVEGQVLRRSGNIIEKAKILNVAITSAPVNPDAQLEFLARSLMKQDKKSPEEMAEEILECHPELKNKEVMEALHDLIMNKSMESMGSLSPLVPESLEEELSVQDAPNMRKEMEKMLYDRLKKEMEKMMGERMELMLNPTPSNEKPKVSTSQIKDVMLRVFPSIDEKKARELALNLVNSAKSYYNS